MGKPSFINSKHKRFAYLDVDDLIGWYEDIYAGKYKLTGDGIPEDMPEGYLLRSVFRYGAVQFKETAQGIVLVPVNGVKRNVYGYPVTATPTGLFGFNDGGTGVYDESDAPIFALRTSPFSKIEKYCDMMERALRVLNQNVLGLSQPVVIQGTQGGEINALTLQSDIEDEELTIPCLDKAAVMAQVLDLNAQDHTQNLIGVINAMDAKCLAGIGVKGSGADKASGITSTETEYVAQQLYMTTYDELNAFNQWADRVNKYFNGKLTIHFELGEGYTPTTSDDPEGMEPTQQEGADNEQ